jgi:hypothetical protein
MIREQKEKVNNEGFLAAIEEGINKYLTGSSIEFKEESPLNRKYDCIFYIKYSDELYGQVAAVFKKNLRPSTFPLIESRFAGIEAPFKMLVSDYITPPIAEMLRIKKIWFVDLAGNMYIEIPGKVFIFITGNKKKEVETRSPLISTASAKVFFYLLKSGLPLTTPYREIASESMVSLGKVSQTLAELKRQEIIKTKNEGIFILQPLKLLELWVQSYLEKLKPQLYRGTYTWPHGSDFSGLDRFSDQLKQKMGIGGERAGELYTGYLKAASMDLWVSETHITGIKKTVKLMESQHGAIRLYSFFSNDIFFDEPIGKENKFRLVHPLIVYADLMEIPDERCRETAQMLKQKFLAWIE